MSLQNVIDALQTVGIVATLWALVRTARALEGLIYRRTKP